jgi:hypothetical protein
MLQSLDDHFRHHRTDTDLQIEGDMATADFY